MMRKQKEDANITTTAITSSNIKASSNVNSTIVMSTSSVINDRSNDRSNNRSNDITNHDDEVMSFESFTDS